MPAKYTKSKPPADLRINGGSGSLTIRGEAGDPAKLPTFEMIGYTGAAMTLDGWNAPVIVDLEGLKVPSQECPIFRQHDPLKIVGHSTAVVVGKTIAIAGTMSGAGPDTLEVVALSKNGFPWQASIGATPVRTEFVEPGAKATVNDREVSGPAYISRETILGEISFVPLGADTQTSATVNASKGKRPMYKKMLLAAGKMTADEVDKMTEDEAKAALKQAVADDEPDADDEKAKAKAKAAADDETAKAKAAADDDKKADAKASAAYKATIQAARTDAANEVRRIASINAAVRKFGVDTVEITDDAGKKKKVNLAAHAIENDWTAETAELHALRAGRSGNAILPGGLAYTTSAPQVTDAVLEAAVLQAGKCQLFDDDYYKPTSERANRAITASERKTIQRELTTRYSDEVQQAAHTMFKGRIGLQQVLTASARATGNYHGGESIRDMGELESVLRASNWTRNEPNAYVRADGGSTASIANVLANVMNKFMLQGYLYVEGAWKEIAAIRPVKDFKPTKSINLFGDFEFQGLGPSGELKNAALQDQAFANQADTTGRILTITRKQIINDDLGMLTQAPMLMGRGAGLKLNTTFWTAYLNSSALDDGGSTAFWAATHTIAGAKANGNYISGGSSPLSSASLQTMYQTFQKQVDPMGYPLGVDPEILLTPVELDGTSRELMNSQYIVMAGVGASAVKQASDNIWKGRFKPVGSRYLSNSNITGYSATAFYLLANPSIVPVIEVAFLNGQEMPTVQTASPDYQFEVLGISIRGFFDFGVNLQNFRGGVKSAGA
jgi:hypothetical protein